MPTILFLLHIISVHFGISDIPESETKHNYNWRLLKKHDNVASDLDHLDNTHLLVLVDILLISYRNQEENIFWDLIPQNQGVPKAKDYYQYIDT